MKIGHYMKGIWQNGGISTYIRRISSAQKLAGHELFFFDTLACQPPTIEREHTEFVEEEHLFTHAARLGVEVLHLHTTLGAGITNNMPAIRTVHTHQPYCPSGARFLNKHNTPCERNYSVTGCLWGHFIDRCGTVRPSGLIQDFKYTRADIQHLRSTPVVAVSEFVRQQMLRAGYPPDLLHVLHHPAPEVKDYILPPSGGVPRFVFLGRLTPHKGIEWLLQSMSKLKCSVHLDIVGEGHQGAHLRALVNRLRLDNQVTFHGWVDPEQVKDFVTLARAVVVPSVWHEPAGLVSLEAAAVGRAVIGSRVGGLPEYANHGSNALLVNPYDIDGLARAISRISQDWNLAQRLGEEGRAMVQRSFTLAGHVEALTNIYRTHCS